MLVATRKQKPKTTSKKVARMRTPPGMMKLSKSRMQVLRLVKLCPSHLLEALHQSAQRRSMNLSLWQIKNAIEFLDEKGLIEPSPGSNAFTEHYVITRRGNETLETGTVSVRALPVSSPKRRGVW